LPNIANKEDLMKMTELWKPRYYYILKNTQTGKKYIGQTVQDIKKYLGSGHYWISHCNKHGGYIRKNIETVWHEWVDNKDAQRKGAYTQLSNGTHNLQGDKNPNKIKYRCMVTNLISTKSGFTYRAKKRLGLSQWPYELERVFTDYCQQRSIE